MRSIYYLRRPHQTAYLTLNVILIYILLLHRNGIVVIILENKVRSQKDAKYQLLMSNFILIINVRYYNYYKNSPVSQILIKTKTVSHCYRYNK